MDVWMWHSSSVVLLQIRKVGVFYTLPHPGTWKISPNAPKRWESMAAARCLQLDNSKLFTSSLEVPIEKWQRRQDILRQPRALSWHRTDQSPAAAIKRLAASMTLSSTILLQSGYILYSSHSVIFPPPPLFFIFSPKKKAEATKQSRGRRTSRHALHPLLQPPASPGGWECLRDTYTHITHVSLNKGVNTVMTQTQLGPGLQLNRLFELWWCLNRNFSSLGFLMHPNSRADKRADMPCRTWMSHVF